MMNRTKTLSASMNARRKADRESIARMFVEVAEKFGAVVERRDEPRNPGFSGAGICLSFEMNGVGARVSIDDLHGGDGGLISWYNERGYIRPADGEPGFGSWRYPVRNFSSRFNVAVGDTVARRPHHKATSIGDWEVLAAYLQAGLRHAANGTAFIEESE